MPPAPWSHNHRAQDPALITDLPLPCRGQTPALTSLLGAPTPAGPLDKGSPTWPLPNFATFPAPVPFPARLHQISAGVTLWVLRKVL